MSQNITHKEIAVIMMFLDQGITDMEEVSKDPTLPFNPEARETMNDILTTAKSVRAKLENTAGFEVRLDPYREGDEKQFLTKES